VLRWAKEVRQIRGAACIALRALGVSLSIDDFGTGTTTESVVTSRYRE
jgi:EAL domain-containing protein (putative c-di-GMP-specific phosphodiesterase class I)